MAITPSKSSPCGAGLLAVILLASGCDAVAQVNRSSPSEDASGVAGTLPVNTDHDISRLSDAMRRHNTRLRLMLAERDRQLQAVKSELRLAKQRQQMTDSSGIYPLFIATP
jgi:hypothetical protein